MIGIPEVQQCISSLSPTPSQPAKPHHEDCSGHLCARRRHRLGPGLPGPGVHEEVLWGLPGELRRGAASLRRVQLPQDRRSLRRRMDHRGHAQQDLLLSPQSGREQVQPTSKKSLIWHFFTEGLVGIGEQLGRHLFKLNQGVFSSLNQHLQSQRLTAPKCYMLVKQHTLSLIMINWSLTKMLPPFQVPRLQVLEGDLGVHREVPLRREMSQSTFTPTWCFAEKKFQTARNLVASWCQSEIKWFHQVKSWRLFCSFLWFLPHSFSFHGGEWDPMTPTWCVIGSHFPTTKTVHYVQVMQTFDFWELMSAILLSFPALKKHWFMFTFWWTSAESLSLAT